jgi:hypothetical protein
MGEHLNTLLDESPIDISLSQTMMYLIASFLRGFASQDHMRGPIRKALHLSIGFRGRAPLVDLLDRICKSLTPLDRLVSSSEFRMSHRPGWVRSVLRQKMPFIQQSSDAGAYYVQGCQEVGMPPAW